MAVAVPKATRYESTVFINCPFDDAYAPIKAIRNWLRTESDRTMIPGPSMIVSQYAMFRAALPGISTGMNLTLDELTFVDYCAAVELWLARSRQADALLAM